MAKVTLDAKALEFLTVQTTIDAGVLVRVLEAALRALNPEPSAVAVARSAMCEELLAVDREQQNGNGGRLAIAGP